MALNKRQYVDGQTIVTASNLNEIQDCIITLENNYVPKTRTVAGKALSSNITLSAGDVGAVPTSRTINAKALTGNITLSAADVGAVPVARTVNGKALSSNITLSAADVSAVPTTRKVNSKALSEDISLTASDVGAVPTGRKVNGKSLSSDITLAASDVGAVPTSRTVNNKALSSNITLAASDVGAVPTERTVNGKALSADITLASSDIGDDSGAGGATVKASLAALKNAQQYHVGDTYQIKVGATFFGFVGNAGNVAGGYIALPKDLGSDITGFTITGQINFWGDTNGRITGCTFGQLLINSTSQIVMSVQFPSGTTRPANTVGFVNMGNATVTFT